MAVIINELEVVVEQPAPPTAAVSAAPPAQAQPPIRPLDFMDILERRDRSEWRLMAH